MQMPSQTSVSVITRKLLPAATLSAVFVFASLPCAAGHDDDCSRRSAHAEHKLHQAIVHHGFYSRQADHWRRELREIRERCRRDRRQWWDEHEHRWRSDRDQNDHDHSNEI